MRGGTLHSMRLRLHVLLAWMSCYVRRPSCGDIFNGMTGLRQIQKCSRKYFTVAAWSFFVFFLHRIKLDEIQLQFCQKRTTLKKERGTEKLTSFFKHGGVRPIVGNAWTRHYAEVRVPSMPFHSALLFLTAMLARTLLEHDIRATLEKVDNIFSR